MVRVLVVDDEPSYREYVERYLAGAGHEVRCAASGREAIDVGVRYRPDVVVVDWMLKDHVHGLHVAETLRAVQPDLATILVTGFASPDLRAAAARAHIARFVEKPFDLEEIREAVEAASAAGGQRGPGLAVVETDAEGRIQHASPAARRLFREALGPEDPATLADVFDPGGAPSLEAAAAGWVASVPAARGERTWFVRTHAPRLDATQLWLLRRDGERTNVPLTEMLLGVQEPLDLRWPFDGRILVLDDDELFRHVAVAILESAGAPAYAAETDGQALRLLSHDEGIRVLVVDYEIPGTDLGALLGRVQTERPHLQIVGNSAFDRAEEFAKLRVDRFLRKPWRPRDLLEALRN